MTTSQAAERGRMAGSPNADAMDAFVDAVKASRGREICAFAAPGIEVFDFMDPGGKLVGRERFYDTFFAPIEHAFDPVSYEVEEVLKSEDSVVLLGAFQGVFVNDYYGFPAHGGPVRWTFHDAYFFNDGELVRVRFGNDTLVVASELGARLDDRRLWIAQRRA